MSRLGLWKEKRGNIHTEDGRLIIIFDIMDYVNIHNHLLSLCSNVSFLIQFFFLLHVVPCSVRWPAGANHSGRSETTGGMCGDPRWQELTQKRKKTHSVSSTSAKENWWESFSSCHFNSWPEHKTWNRTENMTKQEVNKIIDQLYLLWSPVSWTSRCSTSPASSGSRCCVSRIRCRVFWLAIVFGPVGPL